MIIDAIMAGVLGCGGSGGTGNAGLPIITIETPVALGGESVQLSDAENARMEDVVKTPVPPICIFADVDGLPFYFFLHRVGNGEEAQYLSSVAMGEGVFLTVSIAKNAIGWFAHIVMA
jgi:hypothetical protein